MICRQRHKVGSIWNREAKLRTEVSAKEGVGKIENVSSFKNKENEDEFLLRGSRSGSDERQNQNRSSRSQAKGSNSFLLLAQDLALACSSFLLSLESVEALSLSTLEDLS